MQAIEVMSRTKPTSTLTKKALQMVGIQRDLLEEKASRAVNTTLAMLNRLGFTCLFGKEDRPGFISIFLHLAFILLSTK